eukprot:TRINITY_DN9922_c0_g1_i1.p1 TRINITY_DN9922_c0_g1~~TRINITY_DN9922_c0_g1_i1.p1  ORF type:complete len:218 (+),score=67.70 TRINITY_DN9922_c0_g1_i1:60-656(+)
MADELNYDASFKTKDIVQMTETLVKIWKTKAEDLGEEFDSSKVFKTCRSMLGTWNSGTESEVDVVDFQAMLGVLRGCVWLGVNEKDEVGAWQEIVDSSDGWQHEFNNDKTLTAAVVGFMQPEGGVKIERDRSGISITYKRGDYGTGVHDGTLILNNTSLCIFNNSTPSVKSLYTGQLPNSIDELTAALEDESWDDVAI